MNELNPFLRNLLTDINQNLEWHNSFSNRGTMILYQDEVDRILKVGKYTDPDADILNRLRDLYINQLRKTNTKYVNKPLYSYSYSKRFTQNPCGEIGLHAPFIPLQITPAELQLYTPQTYVI